MNSSINNLSTKVILAEVAKKAQVETVELLMAFPALLLEDEHLVCFYVAFHHRGHRSAAHRRGANLYVTTFLRQKHLVELDLGALFGCEAIHEHKLVFLYLVLVPCDLYDCNHFSCD